MKLKRIGSEKQKKICQNISQNVEKYDEGYNVSWISNAIHQKLYKEAQSLPLNTHVRKNLSFIFVIGLLIWNNWNVNCYKLIQVIVYWWTKIVYNNKAKTMIHTFVIELCVFNAIERYDDI